MKKNVKFISVSDRELLANTCLSLLTMIRNCNDEEYLYFLRKAFINLNALVKSMEADKTTSVTF